jgi:hypothetical protein
MVGSCLRPGAEPKDVVKGRQLAFTEAERVVAAPFEDVPGRFPDDALAIENDQPALFDREPNDHVIRGAVIIGAEGIVVP